MLTTRANGRLGSVSWGEYDSLLRDFFFFNHPPCTEVGEFRCGERKISHSISPPQIYEVWCFCFNICLVQISYANSPTEALRGGQPSFLVARCLTLTDKARSRENSRFKSSTCQHTFKLRLCLPGWDTVQACLPGLVTTWSFPSFLSWLCFYITARGKMAQPTSLPCCFSERRFSLFYTWSLAKPWQWATHCHSMSDLYADSTDTSHLYNAVP